MNPSRFDRFASMFARRLTRRRALAASAAGLTAAGFVNGPSVLSAQDATTEAGEGGSHYAALAVKTRTGSAMC